MTMNRIFLVLVSAILFTFIACNTNNEKKETMDNNAIDRANMNEEVKPGNDFFKYVNGGFLLANPIPDEYSRYGAFEILNKSNQERIRSIIKEVSADTNAEKGSPAQQIGDFYTSGMNTKLINKLGYQPLKPIFKEINNIKDNAELFAFIAKMNKMGSYPMFSAFVGIDQKNTTRNIVSMYQGGLGLPDRDYYLSNDDRFVEIRKAYKKHLEKMFRLVDTDMSNSTKNSKIIFDIEKRLAMASKS